MQAMEEQLSELCRLAAKAENRMTETGIPRVAMVQGKIPEHELNAVYDPMINVVLRGSKSMTVGDRTLHYCPGNYFVMSIDLPAAGTVSDRHRRAGARLRARAPLSGIARTTRRHAPLAGEHRIRAGLR
ncbi:hypothetical protein BH09PSE5_BH09PSE5_40570 [soil metagenome]